MSPPELYRYEVTNPAFLPFCFLSHQDAVGMDIWLDTFCLKRARSKSWYVKATNWKKTGKTVGKNQQQIVKIKTFSWRRVAAQLLMILCENACRMHELNLKRTFF